MTKAHSFFIGIHLVPMEYQLLSQQLSRLYPHENEMIGHGGFIVMDCGHVQGPDKPGCHISCSGPQKPWIDSNSETNGGKALPRGCTEETAPACFAEKLSMLGKESYGQVAPAVSITCTECTSLVDTRLPMM